MITRSDTLETGADTQIVRENPSNRRGGRAQGARALLLIHLNHEFEAARSQATCQFFS